MPVTGGNSFAHYDSSVAVVDQVDAIASTSAGQLRGARDGAVAVWRGVPYAEQPVGERRFVAPGPLQPWTGIRDARGHGPLPPQGKSFIADRGDPTLRDEACLTLTVWSPDPRASLPVMVWIPGGAFLLGAGQLELYNGSRLAANGNVVVVNVTYRIGVFGGFELGSLGDGFDDNLCLRDQIAALGWVRDNIAAFGGDPKQVTVFGESAGATSVLALLTSPAAEGLFGRAIAQSPALGLIAGFDARAEQAQDFLAEVGAAGPDELKTLPQRTLRRAAGFVQVRSVQTSPTLAYGLTHGTELLPRHPVDAARAGVVARLPLIIGTNSHEASMFAWGKPPMLPTTTAGVRAFLDRVAPDADERVLSAYPDYPRRRALVAFGSDATFGAPTWAFTDAYSAHAPTYAYRFDHTSLTLRALGLGATHGSEIVHIHHNYGTWLGRRLHPLGERVQPSVGRRMQRSWLDFVTGEQPLRDWPRYDVPRRATRVIRTTRDVIIDDPDAVRRTAWEGVY
jgi:para-nitrobenzyl esterase